MGGAELQIKYLIDLLINNGFKVYFICIDQRKADEESQNDFELYRLKCFKFRQTLGSIYPLYHLRIIRELNRIKPDIIYTRTYTSWSGLVTKYAKKRGIKHLWAIASDSDVSRVSKKIRPYKIFDLIERHWVKKAFKDCDFILTQNEFQQNKLLECYKRSGILIKQSTYSCPEKLIKKDNKKLSISWIANFKPLKRPELFIELVEAFNNNPEFDFIMIGRMEKKYKHLMEKTLSKYLNFKYLGEIENDKVNEILCKCHILINTSLFEGFSNTFVQAWMRKVIVISMNSDPDKILTRQGIGFVRENINDVVLLLKELGKDPLKVSELGDRAFSYSNENHSYEKNSCQLLNLML